MNSPLTFDKTPTFEKLAAKILSEGEYLNLIRELSANPARGAVIPHGGGLRKIRVAAKGRGKSGGARVIYYYIKENSHILFITIYAKSAKENLTGRELAVLRNLIEEI
jgi:hypothetical protein